MLYHLGPNVTLEANSSRSQTLPLLRDKLLGNAAHLTFLLLYYGEAELLLHCVPNGTLGTKR